MILGVALLILGVVFLIVALYTLLVKSPKSRAQVERRTGKTTGRVAEVHVKIHRRKKKSGIGYFETKTYKADFSYNVGGTDYSIKGVPVTPAPGEGEEVEISYNPDDPADAHADKYFANPYSNKVGGLILLVLAAVLLILGVICFLAS